MALVVITVSDTPSGEVAVSLIAEPAMNPAMPVDDLTPAQTAAMRMIDVMQEKEASRILMLND